MEIKPEILKINKVENKNKIDIISMLYNTLKPAVSYLQKDIVSSNKYVKLAVSNNYDNYRIGTIKDLMDLGILDSFSVFNKQFFNEEGIFLAIFNTYSGKPISIVFRSLNKKEFMDYSVFTNIYGLDSFSDDYSYGDSVVVTEGIYDADVFRSIYPNISAIYTSSISLMQAELLSTITNSFILAFDSDDAGERGYITSLKNLTKVSKYNNVDRLIIFNGDSDLGNIEDKEDGNKEIRIDYYKNSLKALMSVEKDYL